MTMRDRPPGATRPRKGRDAGCGRRRVGRGKGMMRTLLAVVVLAGVGFLAGMVVGPRSGGGGATHTVRKVGDSAGPVADAGEAGGGGAAGRPGAGAARPRPRPWAGRA